MNNEGIIGWSDIKNAVKYFSSFAYDEHSVGSTNLPHDPNGNYIKDSEGYWYSIGRFDEDMFVVEVETNDGETIEANIFNTLIECKRFIYHYMIPAILEEDEDLYDFEYDEDAKLYTFEKDGFEAEYFSDLYGKGHLFITFGGYRLREMRVDLDDAKRIVKMLLENKAEVYFKIDKNQMLIPVIDVDQIPFDKDDGSGFNLVHCTGYQVLATDGTWLPEYENSYTVNLGWFNMDEF